MSRKKRPFMPLYMADFLLDTGHLNAAETGAYLLLIMSYWMHGQLPVDDVKLARIARMTGAQWGRSKGVIKAFFVSPTMTHLRIDRELALAAEISNKRKGAAVQMHLSKDANAHTLHTSHLGRKKDAPSAPIATVVTMNNTAWCAPMPLVDQPDVAYYERARSILGDKSGGSIGKKLFVAQSSDYRLARASLEIAATKSNPMEYIQGIIRKAEKAASDPDTPSSWVQA